MEDIHGAVLGKDGRGKDAMVKEGFYTRITGAGAPAVLQAELRDMGKEIDIEMLAKCKLQRLVD